ncbi:hypothetical protein [Rickettsia endosymbiont of Cantharis rufa]|uniref:hypothetical protein n=1 Tax=Rickettsia endosymbiont of Cantharis rufa TaxID=3066248 RepID=UPI003133350B
MSLAYYGTDFLNYQENLKEIQTNLTPNIKVIDTNILSNNFKNDSKNKIKDVIQKFYHISNNPIIKNMAITNVVNSGRKMIHNFNIYCLKIDTV